MADAHSQVARVIAESDVPADATQERTLEPDIPADRTRQFTHTSLARMKKSWTGDDAMALGDIEHAANQAVQAHFGRALRVIKRLQEIAQIPETDGQGEVLYHLNGERKVRLDEHGDPVEDWSRLSDNDRRNALHVITIHLYEWERTGVRLWGQAMFAKVNWEQAFSRGFRVMPGAAISGKPTIDDRTQWGHAESEQDRYFAVFCSVISREADALIRNLVRIQRLLGDLPKD